MARVQVRSRDLETTSEMSLVDGYFARGVFDCKARLVLLSWALAENGIYGEKEKREQQQA